MEMKTLKKVSVTFGVWMNALLKHFLACLEMQLLEQSDMQPFKKHAFILCLSFCLCNGKRERKMATYFHCKLDTCPFVNLIRDTEHEQTKIGH